MSKLVNFGQMWYPIWQNRLGGIVTEFGERELAMWYPKPLIAFEGNNIVWLNHSASYLVGESFANTLAALFGEEAANALAGAAQKREQCSLEVELFQSVEARAELVYIGGAEYVELSYAGQPEDSDIFSSLLSNVGQLMLEPLSEMKMSLDELDEELGDCRERTREAGAGCALNFTDTHGRPGKSLPLELARLSKGFNRMLLLSRNLTALSDLTERGLDSSGGPCEVYDAAAYLRELVGQAGGMLKPQDIELKLKAAGILVCTMPAKLLRYVVTALVTIAAKNRESAAITLELRREGDSLRLSVPIPGERFIQFLTCAAFNRSPESAGALSEWAVMTAIRRILGKHGGKLLLNAGKDGGEAVVYIPLYAGMTGVLETSAGREPGFQDNDIVFLSDVLLTDAFLPEWTDWEDSESSVKRYRRNK